MTFDDRVSAAYAAFQAHLMFEQALDIRGLRGHTIGETAGAHDLDGTLTTLELLRDLLADELNASIPDRAPAD